VTCDRRNNENNGFIMLLISKFCWFLKGNGGPLGQQQQQHGTGRLAGST
jgi:hypothetical protein